MPDDPHPVVSGAALDVSPSSYSDGGLLSPSLLVSFPVMSTSEYFHVDVLEKCLFPIHICSVSPTLHANGTVNYKIISAYLRAVPSTTAKNE